LFLIREETTIIVRGQRGKRNEKNKEEDYILQSAFDGGAGNTMFHLSVLGIRRQTEPALYAHAESFQNAQRRVKRFEERIRKRKE